MSIVPKVSYQTSLNFTVKTRSRAKVNPDQYTMIPADAKILKLLIGEGKTDLESKKAFVEDAGSESDNVTYCSNFIRMDGSTRMNTPIFQVYISTG